MLTLAQMKTQVTDRITIDDSEYQSKIVNWLNYRYDDIVGRHDWPQLFKQGTLSIAAGETTATFPRDVEFITNLFDKTNNIWLNPLNPTTGNRGFLSVLNSNGLTTSYWWEGVSVLKQPTTTSTIYAVSTSTADVTQTVRVWGTDTNGAQITQTAALNGTTEVAFTTDMARIDRVSKDTNAAGLIKISDTGQANVYANIDPFSYGSTSNIIRVVQPSSTALTLTYTYKVRVVRLINDEDVPLLDCSHALVIGAYVDALRQQRQHSKAKILEYNPNEPYDPTTYEGKVRSLIQKIEQQSDNVPLFSPTIDRSNIDRNGIRGFQNT